MVCASQLAVPRLAISRMFGVRSMLSASGRKPSIETTTTSGVGGGGVGVGAAVGTVGAPGEPQETDQSAAVKASATPDLRARTNPPRHSGEGPEGAPLPCLRTEQAGGF